MPVDMHKKVGDDHVYDVIILGTGIGGGMLGSILASETTSILEALGSIWLAQLGSILDTGSRNKLAAAAVTAYL